MRHLFQKLLNNENKLSGEIYFQNNEILTNLNNGLDFVNINNKFEFTSNSKYFSIIENNLSIKSKKLTKLILSWNIFTKCNENIALSFRIKKLNKKDESVILDSSRINTTSNTIILGKTIITVDSGDKFIMQIKNNDVKFLESNILIPAATLRLEI